MSFSANFRIGRKYLVGTNTLAYFSSVLMMNKNVLQHQDAVINELMSANFVAEAYF
jgi:hypothetical protein